MPRPVNAVSVYDSTDDSAAVLNGNAGTLQAVLREVLVNGGPTRSVTSITRAGSICTVTQAANIVNTGAYRFTDGQYITISGASPVDYNGTWQLINGSVGGATWQFNIGAATPTSPATGTILARIASLGWTEPFNDGANVSCFRPPAGNQFYLWMNDNHAGTNTTMLAQWRGYEAMSAHTTGTGLFPTAAQMANGIWPQKSNATGATVRAWRIVGDGYGFYLQLYPSGAGNVKHVHYFGDLLPMWPGDAYHTAIVAGPTTAANSSQWTAPTSSGPFADYSATVTGVHYVARAQTQTGTAVRGVIATSTNGQAGGSCGNWVVGSNSPITGYDSSQGMVACPIYSTAGRVFRGQFPGIYDPQWTTVVATIADGTQFTPVNLQITDGRVPSNSLTMMYCYYGTTPGSILIDTVGPWR